ncbi:MAG: sigma-70 family RNA polymerase sigma factor [Steroidobacteraceae bacterium]
MDASATSDEALLLRYAGGDVAAFEALYERHELPLWRFTLRLCGGQRANAQELVQEVWFAVTREAPRFKPDARFTAWLYTIARNRVIDRHRTARHYASLDAIDGTGATLAESLADPDAPQPPQQAEQAEQGAAILRALETLPEDQREAFVLQTEGGLSVEEIANITGTTLETAKSRLRYARHKLKALLRDYA